MTTVLIVAQIFIVILLILLVLLQKSDSDAVSSLGGGGNGVVSHHAANNIITKITMALGILFICNSIAIARTAYVEGGKVSKIIEDIANSASPIKPTDSFIAEEKSLENNVLSRDVNQTEEVKNRAPRVE